MSSSRASDDASSLRIQEFLESTSDGSPKSQTRQRLFKWTENTHHCHPSSSSSSSDGGDGGGGGAATALSYYRYFCSRCDSAGCPLFAFGCRLAHELDNLSIPRKEALGSSVPNPNGPHAQNGPKPPFWGSLFFFSIMRPKTLF